MMYLGAKYVFVLNITLHRNRLLILVKRLAAHILTRKYRIRQKNTSTGNKISAAACLGVGGGRFQHLLQSSSVSSA
jgi:hypothetical protein